MKTYTANWHIKLADVGLVEPGTKVELDDEQAEQLGAAVTLADEQAEGPDEKPAAKTAKGAKKAA